jgi:rod shape-determining protein MreC
MIGADSRPIRTSTLLLRLLLFAALAVTLMVADHQGQHLRQIRSALSILTYPLVTIAAIPARVGSWMSEAFTSEEKLRERYLSLEEQHRILQARLQQYEALEVENRRLRTLLGSASRVADRAVVAELVEVSTEPFTRTIVINKGSFDNVFLGQPVLDAYGIVGQVTEVNPHISRVTLITDPGHAIPVQVTRTGLRTVLYGTGDDDTVDLPFLTASAKIEKGDLLTSSGMGGRFPPRYPVARVTEIINDPNEAFLQIKATPLAKLQHHKEVLLVWPGKTEPQPLENP